jgi:hypothetical protein
VLTPVAPTFTAHTDRTDAAGSPQRHDVAAYQQTTCHGGAEQVGRPFGRARLTQSNRVCGERLIAVLREQPDSGSITYLFNRIYSKYA